METVNVKVRHQSIDIDIIGSIFLLNTCSNKCLTKNW